MDSEGLGEGVFEDSGSTVSGGLTGSAGVAVVAVHSDDSDAALEAGVPDSDVSCDGGSRGSKRIGTESR